jgi:hypothetical protein
MIVSNYPGCLLFPVFQIQKQLSINDGENLVKVVLVGTIQPVNQSDKVETVALVTVVAKILELVDIGFLVPVNIAGSLFVVVKRVPESLVFLDKQTTQEVSEDLVPVVGSVQNSILVE